LRKLHERGFDADFAKDGVLHEGIAKRIFSCEEFSFSDQEIEEAFLTEQERLLSYGITEVYAFMFIGIPFEKGVLALRRLESSGRLFVKVRLNIDVYPESDLEETGRRVDMLNSYRSDMLGLSFCKVYIDGVIDNHSAFLKDDYSDINSKGFCLWTKEKILKVINFFGVRDIPVHAHAIGDAAVGFITRALLDADRMTSKKHMITHIQLCDDDTLALLPGSGISVCLQPFWFFRGKDAGKIDKLRLGQRVNRQYPNSRFIKSGIDTYYSSDNPVTAHFPPLLGIKEATKPDSSGESTTVFNAYRAFYAGRYQGESMEIGNGDEATFIILDKDIFNEKIICEMPVGVFVRGKRMI
jgi:hypothetical protein